MLRRVCSLLIKTKECKVFSWARKIIHSVFWGHLVRCWNEQKLEKNGWGNFCDDPTTTPNEYEFCSTLKIPLHFFKSTGLIPDRTEFILKWQALYKKTAFCGFMIISCQLLWKTKQVQDFEVSHNKVLEITSYIRRIAVSWLFACLLKKNNWIGQCNSLTASSNIATGHLIC